MKKKADPAGVTSRSLIVEFTKMEGAGNDFIVIDNRFFRFSTQELASLAKTMCPRHIGIGADGLLALDHPSDSHFDFRMRYHNADGSLGTMCGNGARCIAVFAREAGIEGRSLRFETDAGVYRAEVADDLAAVTLSIPSPYPPLSTVREEWEGVDMGLYRVWTGTEHVVLFTDTLDRIPVEELGRRIRTDPRFAPNGTNVNFAESISSDHHGEAVFRARTYEKGVEQETLACGTGALAIAVAAVVTGRSTSNAIRVLMPGGVLLVRVERDDAQITGLYLEGPVRNVFRGTFEVASKASANTAI